MSFINEANYEPAPFSSLNERFIVPPFSILDTRQGYWQDRKRAWHALGINSQETREDVEIISKSGQGTAVYELRNKMRSQLGSEPTWEQVLEREKKEGLYVYEGASIFDPVLTEIAYTWFCPPNATILDPFAGGSVRGIVAAYLGYHYKGIDLRLEQVEANIRNSANVLKDNTGTVEWFASDSLAMDNVLLKDEMFDFIFSCPPYFNLEQYSDDKLDLSNMKYNEFLNIYSGIIFNSLMRLKKDRFACFVVGDIRDENGLYRNFVSDTIEAFIKQPLCDGIKVSLYNEIILINVAGSLPIRVNKQFGTYRKVGKTHQNVLVFYKGDPKTIKENFPQIEVAELEKQPE